MMTDLLHIYQHTENRRNPYFFCENDFWKLGVFIWNDPIAILRDLTYNEPGKLYIFGKPETHRK